MFCGETIFIDHTTSKVDIHYRVSVGASDAVQYKELYEQEAMECGGLIQSYRGNNSAFKTKTFKDDIRKRKQLITLSGVGTHGQNGVVERAIQKTVNSARTMMLHQALL